MIDQITISLKVTQTLNSEGCQLLAKKDWVKNKEEQSLCGCYRNSYIGNARTTLSHLHFHQYSEQAVRQ